MRAAPGDCTGDALPRLAAGGEHAIPDDDGSIYTALDAARIAERHGLVPITTPAYSPHAKGMSEGFVNTLCRAGYLACADRSAAALMLDHVPKRIGDYDRIARNAVAGRLWSTLLCEQASKIVGRRTS